MNSIEDDLREILFALKDIDGVDISIKRPHDIIDSDVLNFRAGDITGGANKLVQILNRHSNLVQKTNN